MSALAGQQRLTRLVGELYPHLADDALQPLVYRLVQAAGIDTAPRGMPLAEGTTGEPDGREWLPSQAETVLITYGDSITDGERRPLEVLDQFCTTHPASLFSTIHVLPFFPSSSDGGFSVVDHTTVDPALGDWDDLRALTSDRDLMADLVCNHGSASSPWAADLRADRSPGNAYFRRIAPTDDLSAVVRPRTHDLRAPIVTATGTVDIWATFSHDQLDFDYENPDVLVEFARVIGLFLDNGITRVRLDAIAYVWKQLGTRCIHLPQAHTIVKIFRELVRQRDPHVLVISETNVPHTQNISYFGDGDEAQVVYNFTLAPMLVSSVLRESTDELVAWLDQLAPPPAGCTFLNFIATHDGIGVRPVEDLLGAHQMAELVDAAVTSGGGWSSYSTPAGDLPYELNVSLADLLAGPDRENVDRFVAAHAALLALQGIPAIYIHSLLLTAGDQDQVAATGHRRDINRPTVTLEAALRATTHGRSGRAVSALCHLLWLRRSIEAFAPAQPQRVAAISDCVLVVERGKANSAAGNLIAVQNLSSRSVAVDNDPTWPAHDLVTDTPTAGATLRLDPWQTMWLQTPKS